MAKFKVGQLVKRINGGTHKILSVPDEQRKLEHCDEPFYEYESVSSGEVWLRCQSEMEDGRFVDALPEK